ncbi:hypothetical protein [Roseovarius sp. MBR-6]|uniref:hypothetical protein n=1 Tax=Roseovarius sp. MBR-6 TaxID=3156459 RepID=UPI00339B17E3
MVELLFIACLSVNPTECNEQRLIFGDMTPARCMAAAQPELARWSELHPELRINRWRCRALT